MKYNGDFDLEVDRMEFNTDAEDAAKAKRRMDLICATPAMQSQYKWNPLGARNNRYPAQPIDENESTDYSD